MSGKNKMAGDRQADKKSRIVSFNLYLIRISVRYTNKRDTN